MVNKCCRLLSTWVFEKTPSRTVGWQLELPTSKSDLNSTYFAMGSGVSVAKDALGPILLSQELLDGSMKLVTDPLFCASFTNYLKSGIWLDRLSRFVPEPRIALCDIARGGSNLAACLNEYGVSHDRLMSLKSSSSEKSIPAKPSLHSSSKSTAFDGHGDLYSGETTSFQQEELLIILFTMVYPFYLSSYEFERYVKYGIEHGKGAGAEDDHSSRSSVTGNQHGAGVMQDNSSKRAQELLLSCAAYYDETFLQQYLEEPSWLQRVCSIFYDHTLALCITDTSKGGLPILFANTEFCQMFGYAESELVGHDFTSLSGASTEMPQLTLMHSNIHSTAIVKFAITLQNKSKKPLLDLVAQKAVGTYSISAHCVMTKSVPLDALNMVDDVLILLSYLVKAPALPVRPSWLPTPIVILARSASNALYAASPSSVRSRSSSSSLGNRSRTHSSVHGQPQGPHSKDGKGTPTSFRSHGGGGVILSSSSGSTSNSFRSIRTGGMRRRSRGGGENGTPTSHRSGASGRSAAAVTREIDAVSAGLHVPMDVDDIEEVSMGESAHTKMEQQYK